MCPGCVGLCCLLVALGVAFYAGWKAISNAILPFALLVCLLTGSPVVAQAFQATPNTPIVTGDELWVMRNGRVVKKVTGGNFTNGDLISVNGIAVGSAMCPPRNEPPQYAPPPQFELPKPEVIPPAPLPPIEIDAGGPNLLQIALFVAALVGGYYVGRKAASDDKDEDEPVETAVG